MGLVFSLSSRACWQSWLVVHFFFFLPLLGEVSRLRFEAETDTEGALPAETLDVEAPDSATLLPVLQ